MLRAQCGVRSAKDGCSPQGQCGCCTVWVDGAPRVACVTPVRRMTGRQITTLEGLDTGQRERWAAALLASGGSQCGFCTPGIIMRLAAPAGGTRAQTGSHDRVDHGLAAHLCRCTGWQTIVEAADSVAKG
ncbi:MAG: 2Fe-2S iron-sulfur cluster-binding protein, partial [Acidimicrobiales bacterium]